MGVFFGFTELSGSSLFSLGVFEFFLLFLLGCIYFHWFLMSLSDLNGFWLLEFNPIGYFYYCALVSRKIQSLESTFYQFMVLLTYLLWFHWVLLNFSSSYRLLLSVSIFIDF